MKNFTVLYIAPVASLDEWAQKPEAERKEEEETMMREWKEWEEAHADAVKNTIALGVTKRVNESGVTDTRNGIMLSSYVSAESLEDAAELFADHPHLKIPGATIDIMEALPM